MYAIKTFNKEFIFLSILIFLQNLSFVFAETFIKKSEEEILTTANNLPIEIINSQYIVDTGDSLYINFRNIEIFSRAYNVDNNGELLLPELGLYLVRGKTIEEINSELTEKYKEVIINPNIEITIANYRPLKIYINGEVNRPGLYQLNYTENKKIEMPPENIIGLNSYTRTQTNLSNSSFPRLFDALRLVEGLTNKADLSEIRVVRHNAKTLGGGKIQAKVNMLNLLKNGDQSQNIKLFDGDYIFVPASENILLDQLIDINKTNLNPREIEVFISGNVTRPGRIVLRQNTSLVKAIIAAGGKKNSTGNVEFVRLKKAGKSDRRVFKLKDSAPKGSFSNPILISGDIIVVNKNILGKATTAISEIGSPVVNAYGIYKIFD